MKVIKKEDTSKWSYKHTCRNCESELEVEVKDIFYKYYTAQDHRDSSYETYSAICVVCNESFTFETAKIPKLVQLEAKNNRNKTDSNYWLDR